MSSQILVVGEVPPPVHGEARVTEMVLGRLRSEGLDTTLVDTTVLRTRGIGFHLARARLNLVAAGRILARRPGSVYLAGAGGFGIWYLVVLVTCCRLARVRVAIHHHSFAYLNAPARAMSLLTRLGGKDLLHVVLSEGMARRLQQRYPAARSTLVCSNAGLFEPADVTPSVRAGGLRVGHLGNLVATKGVGTSLATARTLVAEGADVRMMLAGPALEPETRAALDSARHDLGDALDYLGPLTSVEVDEFMAGLDLLLFPSTYVHEAEPLVVLEAERRGVPCVAYDVGCLREIVSAPGRTVPRGDDFAAVVREVLADVAAQQDGGRHQVGAFFEARRVAAVAALADLVSWLAR